MTHLGQQLSALIDGELENSKRERVLYHLGTCGSCRDEVAALRTLKSEVILGVAPERLGGLPEDWRVSGRNALIQVSFATPKE